ncbi:leucine-rich repeat extensin-like protein 5 [Sinocyclocheilus grahami]|uniref:leucine-rich repeat extensin-like protein 5 n=1 Tax=Sinocyclocheilus grahami TaxID=75366 RepID=UPI0007AD2547|nr:PREDICTED: leucine-rich repeat extensin-like protein 5 [Sinocyclocheilus grahami]
MDIFQMDLIDWFGEVIPSSPVSPLVLPSPASPLVPPSSCSPVFPPSLPLPPPLIPVSSSAPSPLVPVSPSAHPQSAPSGHSDPPRDFQSPASPWHEDPLSSAPSLRVLDSTSILRPIGYALAPSSLVSTVARNPTSSTGLPRPSGSALVSCRPSAASGLHSSGFASSLRACGSVRLLLPSGFASILNCSAAVFQSPASVAWAFSSAVALQILCVALALRLLGSILGSSSTSSVSVSPPPGVVGPISTMAPPAVDSTVGRYPGWPLELHLAPGSYLHPLRPGLMNYAPFPLPAPHLPHAHLLNPHSPSSVGLLLSARGHAVLGGGELLWTFVCVPVLLP